MKILTVVYALSLGGTERAAQNFAFGYSEIGHDSRCLYTRFDGIRKANLEERLIPVYNLNKDEDCFLLRNWNPNLVHLHSHGISSEEFEKVRNLLPDARYLETNVFSRPSAWVDQIDLSLQLSQWCNWLYKKRSKGRNSAVVPCPINISAFHFTGVNHVAVFRSYYGIKPEDIVIGRVGQAFNGKWSPLLIDIFESLRKLHNNLKLLIVGSPDLILKRAK